MTEPTGMQVDTALVRELAELLDKTNLTEIEVADGERRIRVVRKPAGSVSYAAPTPQYAPAPAASAPVAAAAEPASTGETDWKSHPGLVRSPIVGTAYLTPDPSSPPFAAEGQTVKEGDTLVIVEAMKVMNPIVAPRGGTVRRLMVENGQPIEFDQPLAIID